MAPKRFEHWYAAGLFRYTQTPNWYTGTLYRNSGTLNGSIGAAIYVCHFPPSTGKWNKIEHILYYAILLICNAPKCVSNPTGLPPLIQGIGVYFFVSRKN